MRKTYAIRVIDYHGNYIDYCVASSKAKVYKWLGERMKVYLDNPDYGSAYKVEITRIDRIGKDKAVHND